MMLTLPLLPRRCGLGGVRGHHIVILFCFLFPMFSSPQVAGVPRFRFGPPEDMPQTSSSHSDLGQLASQGGG